MNLKETNLPVILIVDDMPKNIQVVGNILRNNLDCDFTFATDGRQALNKILTHPPDLILLDIMMPEMDGFDVCRELKNHEKTKHIPVIFLTARTETDDIIKGFEIGAVDYVSKPFNPLELLERVRTQLKIKHQQDTILQQNAEQKELLHVLCHDLSNPFSSIISALEIIGDYEKFNEFKPHLLTIANQGLGIIDLIRKMRKLEDKKIKLHIEPIPLSLLVEESHLILKKRFTEKNIRLRTDFDPNLAIVTEITSFVNSVLNNILTNAIKFSQPDSDIELIASLNDEKLVEISIIDHGIGMSEKLLQDLFDIEKSCSRPGTTGEDGTGFGMPLVQKFVEAYGGKIIVNSSDAESNHGTTVSIILNGLIQDQN